MIGVTVGNGRVGLNVYSLSAALSFPLEATGSSLPAATIALHAAFITLCIATAALRCYWYHTLPLCRRRRRVRHGSIRNNAASFPAQSFPTSTARGGSLPVELIERIADYLFQLETPIPDLAGTAPIVYSKQPWAAVEGFMSSSIHLHNIGFVRWLRAITVVNPDDWAVILQYSQFVREIQCLDGALSGAANQHVLAQLLNLYAARIDVHGDVWQGNDGRFTYQDVFAALPPSLRRLEVTNAHGPDINVISTVKKFCPGIEELRLGRCTMFNRIPACNFWCAFPHDHDAYISAQGTTSYAHSLGGELSSLKNLRSLRMGLYLVPFDIVLAHRLYHRYGNVAPAFIDWQTAIPLSELLVDAFIEPENIELATTDQLVSILHQQDSEPGTLFDCQLCADMMTEVNRVTEMAANGILRGYVPSLNRIEWMAWLTPGHLGVHSYTLFA